MQRKAVYPAARVHALFGEMKQQLRERDERHAAESARLHVELEKCRADLNALRAAVLARQRADSELVALHREAAIQRAERTERTTQPLN